jgi:hypothetical protein
MPYVSEIGGVKHTEPKLPSTSQHTIMNVHLVVPWLDLPTSRSRIASGEATSREIDLSRLQEFGSV